MGLSVGGNGRAEVRRSCGKARVSEGAADVGERVVPGVTMPWATPSVLPRGQMKPSAGWGAAASSGPPLPLRETVALGTQAKGS